MNGADPRAGQHGIGRFRNHRHVDGDAVALLGAVLLQHIGEAADVFVKLVVGDLLVVIGIVALPDDRHLVAALLQMPVDAVVGDVENAVLVPFDRHLGVFERGVLDLGGRLEPVQPLGVLAPELGRVLNRFRIHLLVGGIVHIGLLFPRGGDRIDFLGHGRTSPIAACRLRSLGTPFYSPQSDSRLSPQNSHCGGGGKARGGIAGDGQGLGRHLFRRVVTENSVRCQRQCRPALRHFRHRRDRRHRAPCTALPAGRTARSAGCPRRSPPWRRWRTPRNEYAASAPVAAGKHRGELHLALGVGHPAPRR